MKKTLKNYLIYTDFFRATGRVFTNKQLLKTIINYRVLPGFRIIFVYRNYKDAIQNNYLTKYLWGGVYKRICRLYGVELPVDCEIGEGFVIYHPNGIVLHPNTKFGNNCSILQQVTVGNSGKDRYKVAEIGDNCSVGAGAKLIGPIIIGDNVSIGANAVVTHSIESNCTVGGVPAKTISINKKTVVYNRDYLSFDEWKNKN